MAGTRGARAIQRGAQKKRVRDEKRRKNKSDPQKADGRTRLPLLETSTPRSTDVTKKKTVSARGMRNMVQWARVAFLGLAPVISRPLQARQMP